MNETQHTKNPLSLEYSPLSVIVFKGAKFSEHTNIQNVRAYHTTLKKHSEITDVWYKTPISDEIVQRANKHMEANVDKYFDIRPRVVEEKRHHILTGKIAEYVYSEFFRGYKHVCEEQEGPDNGWDFENGNTKIDVKTISSTAASKTFNKKLWDGIQYAFIVIEEGFAYYIGSKDGEEINNKYLKPSKFDSSLYFMVDKVFPNIRNYFKYEQEYR